MNNLRQSREKARLSQRELAARVGTSQQQIQRIEAGVQAVRLDLAVEICGALDATLGEVFPQAVLPVARAGKRESSHEHPLVRLYEDEKSVQDLERVGFDMTPEVRLFHFALRNGFEATLRVSGPEYKYLWDEVQTRSTRNFLVFDSGAYRYAINGDQLVFCHFLFEAKLNARHEEEEPSQTHAFVYVANRKEPFEFGLDFAEGDENNDIDDPSEWQNIFGHLRMLSDIGLDNDEVDTISFLDINGERAFFRTDAIALVQVSLAAVEERVVDAVMHEDEDGGHA